MGGSWFLDGGANCYVPRYYHVLRSYTDSRGNASQVLYHAADSVFPNRSFCSRLNEKLKENKDTPFRYNTPADVERTSLKVQTVCRTMPVRKWNEKWNKKKSSRFRFYHHIPYPKNIPSGASCHAVSGYRHECPSRDVPSSRSGSSCASSPSSSSTSSPFSSSP